MKFAKTYLSKEHRYWLGQETESARHFLGIPVTNRMIDYIEYYWLSDAQYERFLASEAAAAAFADECRDREHDDLLAMKPGTDRGVPS
jgi:hypothetical protein